MIEPLIVLHLWFFDAFIHGKRFFKVHDYVWLLFGEPLCGVVWCFFPCHKVDGLDLLILRYGLRILLHRFLESRLFSFRCFCRLTCCERFDFRWIRLLQVEIVFYEIRVFYDLHTAIIFMVGLIFDMCILDDVLLLILF
jgi:hypothetical protein